MMRPVPSPLQLSRLSCHASLDPNSPQIYSKPQLRYCQQTTIPISLYFLRNKRKESRIPLACPEKPKTGSHAVSFFTFISGRLVFPFSPVLTWNHQPRPCIALLKCQLWPHFYQLPVHFRKNPQPYQARCHLDLEYPPNVYVLKNWSPGHGATGSWWKVKE